MRAFNEMKFDIYSIISNCNSINALSLYKNQG